MKRKKIARGRSKSLAPVTNASGARESTASRTLVAEEHRCVKTLPQPLTHRGRSVSTGLSPPEQCRGQHQLRITCRNPAARCRREGGESHERYNCGPTGL